MSWNYCRECRAHHGRDHLMEWQVHNDNLHGDSLDEFSTVRATDAQEAAEKWAEESDCDSAEYTIVGGSDETVLVRPLGQIGGGWVRFVVSGEAVPSYTAREV